MYIICAIYCQLSYIIINTEFRTNQNNKFSIVKLNAYTLWFNYKWITYTRISSLNSIFHQIIVLMNKHILSYDEYLHKRCMSTYHKKLTSKTGK